MLSSEAQNELLDLLQKVPNELSQFINNYINEKTIPNFARNAINLSLDKCSCKNIDFLSKTIAIKLADNLLSVEDISPEVRNHLSSLA